jgi:hypothetical protein
MDPVGLGGGFMEKDHQKSSVRSRVLTHALISLELVAQIFSLALFPTSGFMGGPCPSSTQSERSGNHVSAGSAPFSLQRFLRDFFAFSPSSDYDRDDEDQQDVGWLQVEVVCPQRAQTSSVESPHRRFEHSLIACWSAPPSLPSSKVFPRPAPLCKLTC